MFFIKVSALSPIISSACLIRNLFFDHLTAIFSQMRMLNTTLTYLPFVFRNFTSRVSSAVSERTVYLSYPQTSLLVHQIHNSQLKRAFLESFASDPATFTNTWLESQSRDLESVLGSGPSEGLTVREEELKRSAFFRLPWVEEAVAVQEGMRLASKVTM